MYCEHLQTVKYRDAAAFADLVEAARMSEAPARRARSSST